jgi:putative SOS response-associated peptidase YedK
MAGLPAEGAPGAGALRALVSEAKRLEMKTGGEVFPLDTVPVLTGEGGLKARAMAWGFPGFKTPQGREGRPLINARAETAGQLRTWRKPLESRRCLVPAAGYFEWAEDPEGGPKLKLLFALESGQALFMAGLWSELQPRGSFRFSILTTAANSFAAKAHDRMPVIVMGAELEKWLFGDYAALLPTRDLPLTARAAG